ncbi:Clp protease N-terminal domain-containing protein [Sphaerisporangium corydalis]|uniref:Clp protease N-terminal domain-containing protein n=1 Tax=Sphaerisporangium corydalis TaxID=1441875 RepID=A0ABV9ENW0_9ACTN
MFERFTDSARRAVVAAQEEARRLNHDYIGTEHVLLGLLGEGKGLAATVLKSLGLTLESVRSNVEELVGPGETTPGAHIPFTSRAKKVLELSLREALQLHHNYISTEHILLGLIREGEGVAVRVLRLHEVDMQRVREQLVEGAEGRRIRRLGNPGEDTTMLVASGAASFGARLDRLQESIDRIERRLDALGVPLAADPADITPGPGAAHTGTTHPGPAAGTTPDPGTADPGDVAPGAADSR